MTKSINEKIYYVSGMHCSSCEILIEKKILEIENIKAAEASTGRGELRIEFTGNPPNIDFLNRLFKKENYSFSNLPVNKMSPNNNNFLWTGGIALLIIAVFLILNKSGLSSLVNVNSASALPAFFIFGVLAGISSCAALVGGMVLSMSKKWSETSSNNQTALEKLQPHFLFNIGRIVSFFVFGGVLGGLGSRLSISFGFTSFLVLAVSVLMIFLGLQMLGVKYFQRFEFALPKFITRYIANEDNFNGRYLPISMGVLTFFLPCGFTITAQGAALLSGGILPGALIMLAFALGTAPMLLGIGISSVKFSGSSNWSARFTKIAGLLVLFFALFNLNSQMNVLGITSLNDLKKSSVSENIDGLVPVVEGKQLIKMNASANGYEPNYFKVKSGVPVRWEITDKGTSGCTNAVISRGLFDGQIDLVPGQISSKEFTPGKPGIYKFSCWMGMITGTIEVIDSKNGSRITTNTTTAQAEVSSGAKGCGCGGGQPGTNGTSQGGSCH